MNIQESLVSVIITAYNRVDLLQESLASVFQQTYKFVEIILVDDGSQKPISHTIKSMIAASPYNIKVVRHDQNKGAGAARETGRLHAKGAFIQYLDSDDLLAPNKLSLQVKGLQENTELDISYGRTIYFKGVVPENINSSNCFNYLRTHEKHKHIIPAILDGRLWATSTPLYRTTLLNKIGSWSSLRVCEDVEYEHRLGLASNGLHYISETVAMIREHDARVINLNYKKPSLANHITCYVSVMKNFNKSSLEIDFQEHPEFAINLFFLARKAASLGDKRATQFLTREFLNVKNLSFKRSFSAQIFLLFTHAFGVKIAGLISDFLERRQFKSWKKM